MSYTQSNQSHVPTTLLDSMSQSNDHGYYSFHLRLCGSHRHPLTERCTTYQCNLSPLYPFALLLFQHLSDHGALCLRVCLYVLSAFGYLSHGLLQTSHTSSPRVRRSYLNDVCVQQDNDLTQPLYNYICATDNRRTHFQIFRLFKIETIYGGFINPQKI